MNEGHFKFFESCIPVKGATRSLICDLQRNSSDFIPNDLFEILKDYSNLTIGEIKELFGKENESTIVEYFDFLFREEYIFSCDKNDFDLFPPIDMTWETPSLITNAIIDVDKNSRHDFSSLFNQLEQLGCRDLQLRYFSSVSSRQLEELMEKLRKSTIRSVELVVKFDESLTESDLISLAEHNMRIMSIFVHSAPVRKTVIGEFEFMVNIHYTNEVISDSSHCGFIKPQYFSINLETFSESQLRNSCLNQKISVDVNGEIKNCPAFLKRYGNVNHTRLIDVVVKEPSFQEVWKINKDQIQICQDCEFRYICSDCRAHLTDPSNIYSKPLRCSYNPYTTSWGN